MSSIATSAPKRRRRQRGGRHGAEPRVVIREREERAAALSAEGRSQREIADALGITQPAVWKILRRIDERALRVLHRKRARMLAHQDRCLDYLYGQAQHGWAGRIDRQERVQRRVVGPDGVERQTMLEVRSDTHAGDPRYLREMLRIVESRRRTFRLDATDWEAIADALEPPE